MKTNIFFKALLSIIVIFSPIFANAQKVEIEDNKTSYISGDANGDGVVSIADVVVICNYALGCHSGSFNLYAADIDGNEEITVADIVKTVNIILSQQEQEEDIYTQNTEVIIELGLEAETYIFDAGTSDFTVDEFDIYGYTKEFDTEKFNAGEPLEFETYYWNNYKRETYTYLTIRKEGRYIMFEFTDFLGWEDWTPSAARSANLVLDIKGVKVELSVGQYQPMHDYFAPDPKSLKMGAEGGSAVVTFENIIDIETVTIDDVRYVNHNHALPTAVLTCQFEWLGIKRDKEIVEFTLEPNTTGKDRKAEVLFSFGDFGYSYKITQSGEQIIYTEPTTLFINLGVDAETYIFDAGTSDFTVKGFEIGGYAKSFDKEKFNSGETLEYDTHYYDGNQKIEYTFLKIRKDGRYIEFDFADFLGWEDMIPYAGRQVYMLVNIKGVNVKLYVGQFSAIPDNFSPNPSKVEMGAAGGTAKVTFKNIVDVEALIFGGTYYWNTDNHPSENEILTFKKGWVTVKRDKTEIEFTFEPNTTGKDREFKVLLSWGDDNITYSGIQYAD